jgi:arabinose-5-phosphate isomerase
MERDSDSLISTGKAVLDREAAALRSLQEALGAGFAEACRLILNCRGRVIVTGMGKSGHIGQKIAASLTSTGTAAHFLHPAEGVHGDLGVVHRDDVLLALSLSGETTEIINLLGPVSHLNVPVIAITGNGDSSLARGASVVLLLQDAAEADRHNIVPTTSTTLTLALGDALTITLMEARGFTPQDFAVFHPMGSLGRRLTLQVGDLLRGDETNPVIAEHDSLGEALKIITQYMLGGVSIVDEAGKLSGIITDGDIRRIISRFAEQGGTVAAVMATPVLGLMTRNPSSVSSTTLAYDALKTMENHQPRPIFILPVVDKLSRPVGMLHLHALVQAGFKTRPRGEEPAS